MVWEGRDTRTKHSLLQLMVKLEGKVNSQRADNQNQMEVDHLSNWVKRIANAVQFRIMFNKLL